MNRSSAPANQSSRLPMPLVELIEQWRLPRRWSLSAASPGNSPTGTGSAVACGWRHSGWTGPGGPAQPKPDPRHHVHAERRSGESSAAVGGGPVGAAFRTLGPADDPTSRRSGARTPHPDPGRVLPSALHRGARGRDHCDGHCALGIFAAHDITGNSRLVKDNGSNYPNKAPRPSCSSMGASAPGSTPRYNETIDRCQPALNGLRMSLHPRPRLRGKA